MLGSVTGGVRGKEDFLRVYANLPLDMRKEIILVLDEKPITWNVAYDEIVNDTVFGKKVLEKLNEWKLI